MSIKVPPFYVNHIADTLSTMGVSEKVWLGSCGIETTLSETADNWLSVEQYIKLISSAVELSVYPDIGLRVGARLGIGSHGMLGFALLNCRDLQQAIGILDRYISTRTPLLQTEIIQGDSDVSIILNPRFALPGAKRAFLETVSVTFCNLFITLTPDSDKYPVLKAVSFDFDAPIYANRYDDYFSVNCQFNAPLCKLVLNSEMLHRHFSQADEVALRNLVKQFEQQLKSVPNTSHQSSEEKVLQVIEAEHHRLPTLDEVAKVLFVTPRTLHRRLQQEGTSYRELLVKVKQRQAVKYLDHTQMTIQQVAWNLGYDDVANFRRAFKAWTGVTPGQYRQNNK